MKASKPPALSVEAPPKLPRPVKVPQRKMLPAESNTIPRTNSSPVEPKRFTHCSVPSELTLDRKMSRAPALVRVVFPKVKEPENVPAIKMFPEESTATAWPQSLPAPPKSCAHGP